MENRHEITEVSMIRTSKLGGPPCPYLVVTMDKIPNPKDCQVGRYCGTLGDFFGVSNPFFRVGNVVSSDDYGKPWNSTLLDLPK